MCWHQWWQWFYKEITFLIVIGKNFYNINLCSIDDVLKLYISSSRCMNKQTIMPSIFHIEFFKEFVRKVSLDWEGSVKLHNVIRIKYFKYYSLFVHLFSLCVNGCTNLNTIQRVLSLNLFLNVCKWSLCARVKV